MKRNSIFGFLAGAVLGAGGLYGLKKVLSTFDKDAAPVAATAPSVKPAPAATPSPAKPEAAAAPSIIKEAPAASTDDQASLAGEPEGRHTEPVAATETDNEATSPRSETAEPAVPAEPEVVEAADSSPVNETSDNGATDNGAKKSNRSSRARTDDFTVIVDIGPVFNQKLHDAGIKSFKALAKLTPAEIADKTGIPAERIEHGRWIEQVQELLAAEEKK